MHWIELPVRHHAVIRLIAGDLLLTQRVLAYRPSQFGMSSIVAHELYFGAFCSRQVERNLQTVEALSFAVLDFDQDDARHAGEIRSQLRREGRPIGAYDVLIAGQARARNLVLITHNIAEFGRVQGLMLQDWQI